MWLREIENEIEKSEIQPEWAALKVNVSLDISDNSFNQKTIDFSFCHSNEPNEPNE